MSVTLPYRDCFRSETVLITTYQLLLFTTLTQSSLPLELCHLNERSLSSRRLFSPSLGSVLRCDRLQPPTSEYMYFFPPLRLFPHFPPLGSVPLSPLRLCPPFPP